jgi:hypothetical protein
MIGDDKNVTQNEKDLKAPLMFRPDDEQVHIHRVVTGIVVHTHLYHACYIFRASKTYSLNVLLKFGAEYKF